MNKIFSIIILIFLFCSCQGQEEKRVSTIEKYHFYNGQLVKTLPNLICEFYATNDKFPSSKPEFENFLEELLGSRSDDIFKGLSSLNYSFQFNNRKNELYFYDFGVDDFDDKLEKNYVLDDVININQKGDLLVMTLYVEKCKILFSGNNNVVVLLSNEQEVETPKIFVSEFKNIVNKHVESIRESKESIYVPRSKEEIRKLSLLTGVYFEGNWSVSIKKNEHDEKEILNLIILIENWLNETGILKDVNINEIYLPIKYFSNEQVEVLE